MKQLLQVLFSSLVLLVSNLVSAEEISVNTKDPYAMVESVANKTFARFHQDIATIQANPDHLKVIVSDELMPYIDYKYASYKVMGPYLRQSTPDQRERFAEAFRAYLIATYAQAFTEYTDQQVEFAPAKRFDDEKMVDVNVQIIEQGRPPIKLIFRVRRLKDDTWKAFDLVAEGVSLLSSKSAEITNLIRQNGIDAVIKELETHTADRISLASKETKL
ncbi:MULTISPECIES: ABC transporter substrate-binding protein [unclassified Shewanella]|uniref:MlaC/ttg2D family ABC transporter substrate-binding protein n=1 Tax=unclassified Shewanella TaxID=196818 RepID=UPI00059F55AE|nr:MULTISPECIES: ABC transporter substrate-binding protein [unclassified Shewanella]KIO36654.1 toluene tolerance protein [Shewanella sp. cp20]MCG9720020.1 ABC transporter substrate-binding protein [Shewanella sp. Isolate7]MCG9745122.1 ABC transporter substrate-binding protein [Shewanella sp. Isolate8]